MNEKTYAALEKGFYGVFDPKNRETETFNRALYMLISILNCPKFNHAIKAEKKVIYLADCSTESINQFLDMVKRHGPREEVLNEYIIYSNENVDKFNLALVDADFKSIEFYGTEEFVFYIGKAYNLENLTEQLFEPVMLDSNEPYFEEDSDAESEFLNLLDRCFFQYCIEDSPIYYQGFYERKYPFISSLRDYMIALQDYDYMLRQYE